MSVHAQNWVWEHSSASGSELLMLLALADAADDQGRNAFPSVATLARKTRMARRTVQRLLARLAADGHIHVCRAGGRRSNTYTLVLDHSLEPEPAAAASAEEPPRRPQSPQPRRPPAQSTGGAKMTPRRSDTPRHHDSPGAAQLRHSRGGTAVAPDPSSTCTSSSPLGSTPAAEEAGSGEPDAILAALGPSWQMTPGQARRLRGPIRQALTAGWTPRTLLPVLRNDPGGVRSPYAVLMARLGDLPAAPAARPVRRAWCGRCDQHSRMRETDDDRAYRCPVCHPATPANAYGAGGPS